MMNKYKSEEVDLLELAMFLLRRGLFLLFALLVGGGIGLTAHHFTITPSYRANTEIYIPNSNAIVSYQDIQLSAELTVDYKEILLSRQVMKKVINDQKLDMDYSELQKMISITNPQDSHCLKIFVTADTPEKAVNIANSVVSYGINRIYRIVGKDEPTIIDVAEMDSVEVVMPSMMKYGAIGAMIAFLLVAGVFTVHFLLDSTLKVEEDIEKYMELPVLAVVPENSSYKPQKEKRNKRKQRRGNS